MKKLLVCLIFTSTMAFAQQMGVRTGFNFYNVFWKGKPTGIDGFGSLGKGGGAGIATVIPITKSLSFNPELNLYYRNMYNNILECEESMPSKSKEYCRPGGASTGSIIEGFVMKESLNEWVLGIPLLLRYVPSSNFYLIGGVQLNFSFFTTVTREVTGPDSISYLVEGAKMGFKSLGAKIGKDLEYKYRSPIDVGIALGCGYYITEHFAVDFRLAVDVTNISTKGISEKTKNMEKGPVRSGKVREENDGGYPINPFNKDKGTWLVQYGLGLTYLLGDNL